MSGSKQLSAILALPVMVVLVIPGLLISLTGVNVGWQLAGWVRWLPILAGSLLIGVGFFLLVQTISLFIHAGKGTLAPWDPPQKLVVVGIYRHVRNPMISGVLFCLLGEATLAGSLAMLLWFLVFLAGNLIYIPLSEEKGLEERFGEAYRRYKHHVPAWIPRIKPWNGKSNDRS